MRRFDPSAADQLLSAERIAWLHPEKILAAMAVAPGMRVLDFGCGPGLLTLPLARRIGAAGCVVAADIAPPMLQYLGRRLAEAGLSNVCPVQSDNCRLPFAGGCFDRVALSLVLHEVDDPDQLLREVGRILTGGGMLTVVEFHPWQTAHGPKPAIRIQPAQLARGLEMAGLVSAGPGETLSEDVYLQTAGKPFR